MNVSASLVCDNNTAAVSWQPSVAALYYQVTALGRNGDVKQCNTSNTSCLLPNMVCSETYVITVSPYSLSCKGTDSYPYNYVTGNDNDHSSWHQFQYNCIRPDSPQPLSDLRLLPSHQHPGVPAVCQQCGPCDLDRCPTSRFLHGHSCG